MQHLMSDDEYTEYVKNQKMFAVTKKNQEAIKAHFEKGCPRNRMGYCDECPLQDTYYPNDDRNI